MKQKADIAICHLSSVIFCALNILCVLVVPVFSQGFMPPKESSSTAKTEAHGPLLIGNKVPESLAAPDENGKRRALLTYKSAVEVMVIGFFSSRCSKELRWHELTRFYDDYKGWGVSFLAVNAGPPASHGDLAEQMHKADLPFTIVDDEDHSIAAALKIESIPVFLILDEEGYLRYRGPMGKDAQKAIEAVIGHMVQVPNPEPSFNGGCPIQ